MRGRRLAGCFHRTHKPPKSMGSLVHSSPLPILQMGPGVYAPSQLLLADCRLGVAGG